MHSSQVFVLASLACLTVALPPYASSEASGDVRQPSSGFGTAGLLAFFSGPTQPSKSGSATGKGSSEMEDANSSESPTATSNLSPNSSTGIYTIANVTIHQSPVSASGLSSNNEPQINENVNLWIFTIDSGKPNPATAAQCNLTWPASTASASGPPATGRMKCSSRNIDVIGRGLPNYSPQYNVTFQQQTESPLPGFNVFVTSG